MNSSFLYHAWGIYSLECTREEYKGNTTILHVQSKKPQKTCPKCGKCNLVKNGYRTRDFLGLPIGGFNGLYENTNFCGCQIVYRPHLFSFPILPCFLKLLTL